MSRRGWAWFALWVALPLSGAAGAEQRPELEINALSPDGVFEYQEATGTVADPTGVVVRYGDAELTARKVQFNRRTGEVAAEGSVRLQRGKELWTGNVLRYNFLTRQIQAEIFKAGMPPFFAAGHGLAADLTNKIYTATNAVVTTDDVAEPSYLVRAKSLKIVPGQIIEARQATLYAGGVPVMYLPVYRRELQRHPNNFAFVPGYRSLYGPYLLGSFNWVASTNLEGVVHFDYREKRGGGVGPDLRYDLGKLGRGELQTYFLHDEAPGKDLAGRPVEDDRYRLGFAHSAVLGRNLTAKAALRQQSDPLVLRDFLEREYRQDVQPKSFLELDQVWPNFSLNLLVQPQMNDFFQTVERLPEIKFSGFRQQLGVSPFFYESESSLGYFRFRSAEKRGANYAALRADTFHQLLLPQTFFGWLNLTPRVGGRFTYYGESDGLGANWDEEDRTAFNTGVEVSAKAWRVWRGARSKLLDVTELRHIIEPSVNYVYVPTPSRAPRQLPQFDAELRSLRLLPIDFPDYNSVDSIDSQNTLRFGLRNKLQTKRAEGIDNLLNWGLYTDWRLKPRPDQSTFADLYSDLDLKPRSWLTINSETRLSLNEGQMRMANHTATFTPNETWSWKIGHRYLREDPAFGLESGNNLVLSSFYYRFNENWAIRFTHHFEARDGTMEEQYYTLYRDLRSWTAALTLRFRSNRQGPDDFTVALTFSLKAFPRFRLGQDRDEPSYLLGG
jgi:lipopolysaccharide assembly outer membrane protein LptD (OstA)